MIQCAPGAGLFPHVVDASLVGLLEISGKMLGPVYAGDTVYPMLEISELIEQDTTGVVVLMSTVHNQKGEKVFDGSQKCLIRKRPSSA